MNFSAKELKWIEDNKAILDDPSVETSTILKKLSQEPGIGVPRLGSLVVYLRDGVRGFECYGSKKASNMSIPEAYVNRTKFKVARGIPVLPQNYGKTKIILYKISNGKIVEKKKMVFPEDRKTFADIVNGNYDLVIPDIKKDEDQTDKLLASKPLFIYNVSIGHENYRFFNITGTFQDDSEARSSLKKSLIDDYTTSWGEEVMSFLSPIISNSIDRVVFK